MSVTTYKSVHPEVKWDLDIHTVALTKVSRVEQNSLMERILDYFMNAYTLVYTDTYDTWQRNNPGEETSVVMLARSKVGREGIEVKV